MIEPLTRLLDGKSFPHAVGVVSASNGGVSFFDAFNLRTFDLDLGAPAIVSQSLTVPVADGTFETRDYVPGPKVIADGGTFADGGSGILIADGAWRTEVLSVVVEDELPGIIDLPTVPGDGSHFNVPVAFLDRLAVGDRIVIKDPAGTCGEVSVASIDTTGVVSDSLPAACSNRTRFSVRAAGSSPWVVGTSSRPWLGRTGPDRTFSVTTPYFRRPDNFDPSRPTLSFELGGSAPDAGRDSSWNLLLDSNDLPLTEFVDSNTVGCSASVPAALVYDTVRGRVYVAYPSSNGVIELDPSLAQPGTTAANAICYR